MKSFLLSLIAAMLAIGNALAYSDYVYIDHPLIHPTFDRLIPTSYPTIQPDFSKLVSTTSPLIYPGIPQIHITDNLINSLDKPLLNVN